MRGIVSVLWVLCMTITSVTAGNLGSLGDAQLASQNAPTFYNATTRTASSLLIQFPVVVAIGSGNTIAYEVSKRSLLNSKWEVVSEKLGNAGANMAETQIIEVHVDPSSSITGGTFRLGVVRSGLNPSDFQQAARTPEIPYDATAQQMLSALQQLVNVKVRDVKRCDVFGDGGKFALRLYQRSLIRMKPNIMLRCT